MNAEMIFGMVNKLALLGWFLLMVGPRTKLTRALVFFPVLPAVLAVAYLVLIVRGAEAFGHGGGFGTLTAVKVLFANDSALLAGWTHYLVFDLLIGTSIVRDDAIIAHWKRVPSLLLTFLFGPVGWLVYQIQKRFAESRAGRSVR